MSFQHFDYQIVDNYNFYSQCLNKFHCCVLCNCYLYNHFNLENCLQKCFRNYLDFGSGSYSILDFYKIFCVSTILIKASSAISSSFSLWSKFCTEFWLDVPYCGGVFFSVNVFILFSRNLVFYHFGQDCSELFALTCTHLIKSKLRLVINWAKLSKNQFSPGFCLQFIDCGIFWLL